MKLSPKKSLYVHIPFCEKKCFYCSFAVAIAQQKRVDAYIDCIFQEALKFQSHEIQTVYIGGGTPTFLSAEQLNVFFNRLKKMFTIKDDFEFTVEANPEGLTQEKLQCLKDYGVNRISLGVQTLNNQHLQYLGRVHNAQQAIKAFDLIRDTGFTNVNVDLMFGFPHQTEGQLKKDIEEICSLDSEHVSLYALTIEPNSRFFAKEVTLKSSDEQGRDYQYIIESLENHGFQQYEVSNFAKPQFLSQHNRHYWQCYDYIGLGMGAHAFIDGIRSANSGRLAEYMTMIENQGHAVIEQSSITQQERLTEALLFGLRMNEGVDRSELERRFDCMFRDDQTQTIHDFLSNGFLIENNGRLKTTLQGRLVLDSLCERLY